MTVLRGSFVLAAVLGLTVVVSQAMAGEDGTTHTAGPAAKTHRIKAAHGVVAEPKAASTQQLWSDLVHGSPAQQEMEQRDNAMAGIKPIDHSKEFGHDWQGLQ